MTETALSRSIRDALARAGYWVERIQSGTVRVKGGIMRCASPGTPDLIVILKGGSVCWLEVKSEGGKLSRDQSIWHDGAARYEHLVRVVRSHAEALEAVRECERKVVGVTP